MSSKQQTSLTRYESTLVYEQEKERIMTNFVKSFGYTALGVFLISEGNDLPLPLLKQVSASLKELPNWIPFSTGMLSLMRSVQLLFGNVSLMSDQSNLRYLQDKENPYTTVYSREQVDEIVKKYQKKRNQ